MPPGHRPPSEVAGPVQGKERATLRGHAVTVRSLTFLEGGKRMATRSEDGVVKVWDLSDNHEALSLGEPDSMIRGMAISPDGKSLAVGLRPPPRPKPAKDAAAAAA